MKITREELQRRLEEAARVRTILRQTTREWRAVGDRILAAQKSGCRPLLRPETGRWSAPSG